MRPVGIRPIVLAAALALLPAACGGPTENDGIDRETYVAVYVDLIRSSTEAPDSAAAEDRRAEVLREHGVTPGDLEAFMRRHSDDPGELASIWLEIERRLRGDTVPEGGEPGGGGPDG